MILSSTDLMAVVPHQFALTIAPLGRFRELKMPSPVQDMDVKVHWHERYANDPGNRWLREVLVDLYAEGEARRS